MNSARLKLFEDVRAVVAGRIRDEGQIRELAQRISEESTDLRRRVDRAVSYARGGLRLEACAEAEAAPSVFELSAAFDSPHMRQWRDWCIKQRLPHSEELPHELVGEIEEAIALTRPLRNKLASMRRLVLSDSSAWQRLEILRILVSRDPENHAWQEDRDAMEPVAAKELSERVDALVSRRELTEAEACVKRLEDGKWTWGGIGKVAAQARAKHDRALAQRLAEEAREVVAKLDAEWSAENEDGVRTVLGAWDIVTERMAGCGGQMPADASARVESASAWLAGREESAAAVRDNRDRVAELDRLSQLESATAVQLRAALRAAEQTSEGVPDDVRAVAERRLEAFDRRTLRLRLAAVAAVVLALLVVGAFALMESRRADVDSRVAARHRAMADHLAARRFDKAAGTVEELRADAELGGHPGIGAMQADLDAALKQEEERKRKWAEGLKSARAPGSSTADRDKADRALREAGNDTEAKQAREWLAAHDSAVRAELGRREQEATAALESIGNAMEAATGAGREERLRGIGQLIRDEREKYRDLEQITERFDAAERKLQLQQASISQESAANAQRQTILDLGARASDPESLESALRAFVDANAGSPASAGFEKALESAPAWKAVAAWAALPERPDARKALAASQLECKRRDEALAKYLAANPASPYAESIARFRSLVRVGDVPTWSSLIGDELKNPEWDLQVVQSGGKRWYMAPNPADVKAKQVVVGVDGGALKKRFEQFASNPDPVPSPQAKAKESVAEVLRLLTEVPGKSPGAIESAYRVFDEIARSDIDAVFKARTLRLLAESIAQDLKGTSLAEALAGFDDEVKALPLAGVAWLDPNDAAASDARKRADALLKRELDIRNGKTRQHRQFEEQVAAACEQLDRTYEPAGAFVTVDGSALVVLRPGPAPAPGTELLVVDSGAGAARMQLIGTVGEGGAVALDAAVARQFPQGTMVFRARPARGGRP